MKYSYSVEISPRRRVRERGSAMLVVFVFSAIIAIMLYRELPVVLFEAKRQKEQLLMDRGHEYVRAIQLFYRRNRGQYPASIEQLENTNNIRYLRQRYKDPFTGKDDWRLLHAGPGGVLIDSKVDRGLTGAPGGTGTSGTGTGNTGTSGFGQSSFGQSSFGQSSFGQSSGGQNQAGQSGFSQTGFGSSSNSSSSSNDAEVVVPDVPQRGPAVPASGVAQASTPTSDQLAQNPEAPLLPPSAEAQANGQTGGPPGPPNAPTAPGGNNPEGSPRTGQNGEQNPMQLMNPMLTTPSSTTPQVQGGTNPQGGGGFSNNGSLGSGMGGTMMGGALAGVASKATGHTIKVLEEQHDYSKWEFYYDPSKDRGIASGQPGSPAGTSPMGQGQNSSGVMAGSGLQPSQANTFNSTSQTTTPPAQGPSGAPSGNPVTPPPTPDSSAPQPQ